MASVGVGDIIAVSALALRVHRACSTAVGDFQGAGAEVESLRVVLAAVEKEFPDQAALESHADQGQRVELSQLLDNCRRPLDEIANKLRPHEKLSTPSRTRWDVIKFARVDLSDARRGLRSHTDAINIFLSTLNARRLRRIEDKLQEAIEEARAGRRDFSAIVHARNKHVGLDIADAQWSLLEEELVEAGFLRTDIASHRQWFEARAQESYPSDSDSSSGVSQASNGVDAKRVHGVYTIQRDCCAYHNPNFRLKKGEKVGSMSSLNLLELNPKTVWRFEHLNTSTTVDLEISGLEGALTPQEFTSRLRPPQRPLPSVPPNQQVPAKPLEPIMQPRDQLEERTNRIASNPERRGRTYRRGSGPRTAETRSSSRAYSIKTETSEYDSDGRILRSKSITTTMHDAILPRHGSAPPAVDKEQDLSATERKHCNSQSPHRQESLRSDRHRKRGSAVSSKSSVSQKNQFIVDDQFSFPTSNKSVTDWYEKRTQHLQALMRVLFRAGLIDADPIDYSIGAIDEVPRVIESLEDHMASGNGSSNRSSLLRSGWKSSRRPSVSSSRGSYSERALDSPVPPLPERPPVPMRSPVRLQQPKTPPVPKTPPIPQLLQPLTYIPDHQKLPTKSTRADRAKLLLQLST